MTQSDVTLAQGTIHDPAEPRHYMKLKPVSGAVEVSMDGVVLARSTRAVRVLEVGRDLYDPVVYVPREDVAVALRRTERSTHCPIKGDAAYDDVVGPGGEVLAEALAWSYPEPLPMSRGLAPLVAFDPARTALTIAPEGPGAA